MNLSYKEKKFVEKMYKETYTQVYKICRFKLTLLFEVDECVASIYNALIDKVDTVINHPTPHKWIYKTTQNKIYEYLRERKETVNRDDFDILNIAEKNASIDSDLEYNELLNRIYNYLNEKEKIIFTDYFIKGYTISEISKEYGYKYSNLTSRINRIREKIKKLKNI